MPRLFTGLELPLTVRQQLGRLALPLPGAKWVEPEDLHLTLRFCGNIDNSKARDFAGELAQIHMRVFTIQLSGLGAFGGNDPHTIWAGVDAGPELEQLAKANERAARTAGLAPEPRKFKAHVTVARLRGAHADQVARVLERHAAFKSEPVTIERFVLLSSRPAGGGGPYAVEEVFPLEGSYAGILPGTNDNWK